MTKALCTLAVRSHLELLQYSRPTFERYAERHGYELVIGQEVSGDLPPPWEKLRMLCALLDDHEEVLWVDADAMIVDSAVDLFNAMPADRSVGLVMHVLRGSLAPNTGVLALRAEPMALELLEGALALSHRYRDHSWWEQAAICDLLGFVTVGRDNSLRLGAPTRLMNATQFLGTEWNSIAPDQGPVPRIKHYPSMAHQRRLELMARDARMLAGRTHPPNFDLSIVLLLAEADAADTTNCLRSIASLGDNIRAQTVIVVRPGSAAEMVVAGVTGDVAFVRSDSLGDEPLLEALAAVDGRVVLVTTGPVVVNLVAVSHLLATIGSPGSTEAVMLDGRHALVAVNRRLLPATGWIPREIPSGDGPLEPILRALEHTGVQVHIATQS